MIPLMPAIGALPLFSSWGCLTVGYMRGISLAAFSSCFSFAFPLSFVCYFEG